MSVFVLDFSKSDKALFFFHSLANGGAAFCDDAWRAFPGEEAMSLFHNIEPLLLDMESEGLITSSPAPDGDGSVTWALTDKGGDRVSELIAFEEDRKARYARLPKAHFPVGEEGDFGDVP